MLDEGLSNKTKQVSSKQTLHTMIVASVPLREINDLTQILVNSCLVDPYKKQIRELALVQTLHVIPCGQTRLMSKQTDKVQRTDGCETVWSMQLKIQPSKNV